MPGSIAYAAGRITIRQPEKRNAISAAMWRDLGAAAAAAGADRPGVILVSGEGGHFAAGADISEFADVYATRASAEAYTRVMLASLEALAALPVPTIAVIRGACVGGGCSIALACDFRFAAKSARFAVTPGKLGLVYSLADTRRLARAAGVQGARDLLMTARMVAAEEAFALGLADRLYEDDALDAAVAAFADEARALSSWSLGATKTMLGLLEEGAGDDDSRAMALMLDAFDGAEFKEGYRAFLDKRPPKFR
ncbi:MAG: enoyl-CoA hydratase/isomerase family protein [Parvularculaceae bacterium]|nr:enoyl-CoA hydratase/isomerase family protein [Parvularculaceae bacterium]